MSAQLPSLPSCPPDLLERLGVGLSRVERRVFASLEPEDDFIQDAGGHLLRAGGKWFRPTLSLLAAELGEGATDEVIDAAAAVELTHVASLYHDDVMDEAPMRRGVPSVNALHDNSTAILLGDLLFGTASSILAGLGHEAVKIQADTFVRLCSGQIRDSRPCPAGQDPVEYYLRVLADKTGGLIATAARFGALYAGCDAATVEAMRGYGEKLGIAFQLADDILDISSEAGQSGKTPGTDLREGVDTLPVLLVKNGPQTPENVALRELLGRDLRTDESAHAEALAALRESSAMTEAGHYARTVVREAQELLVPLGENDVTRALHDLAGGVVDRAV